MATIKEEHRYGKGSTDTFSDLKKSISRMGKILNDDSDSLSIEGKIKYGLGASTKVKAKIRQEGDQSIISFESRGGDFAGRAARDNVKHLLETMTKVDDVDHDVDEPSKQQRLRVGYFSLGGLLLIFTALVFSAQWMNLLWLVGLLFVVYIWGYKKLSQKW